jgi:hypothetical protein
MTTTLSTDDLCCEWRGFLTTVFDYREFYQHPEDSKWVSSGEQHQEIMQKGWIIFRAGLFFMMVWGCSSSVKTLYDHETDFSAYRSWCWMQGCSFTFSGPAYLNDSLAIKTIKRSIEQEFSKHGITQREDSPDLLVDFYITVHDEVAILRNPEYTEGFIDRARPPQEEEVHYLKGTLVIDIVDRVKSTMVWRSVVISYFDVHPELSEKNIRQGITMAMKDFPPKAVKSN